MKRDDRDVTLESADRIVTRASHVLFGIVLGLALTVAVAQVVLR